MDVEVVPVGLEEGLRLAGVGTRGATRELPVEPLARPGEPVRVIEPGEERAVSPYVPPPGVGELLKPVAEKMRATLHVSPDAGWPTLSEFFGATRESMTVERRMISSSLVGKEFSSHSISKLFSSCLVDSLFSTATLGTR